MYGAYGMTPHGIFGLLFFLLTLAGAIMAFCVPFFVYRLRCEAISANQKLGAILRLLERNAAPQAKPDTATACSATNVCPNCQTKNCQEADFCAQCGLPL